MTRYQSVKLVSVGLLLVTVPTLLSTILTAQTTKIKGIIKERSGATMILQTTDPANVSVLLTDYTDVGQIQGALKARRKKMSMAALIPGLAIQVEGTYNEQNQLEAEQLTVQQQKISSNKEAIEAAITRFGQLDDYYILDQVSVYFGNGKVSVDTKYKPELMKLAQKAKTIHAYMIEIKGYASSVGSANLNQRLSEDRANNVANFLVQQCHIPLTNMLAPGAMGESNQVGNDKTAEGQAENRRVVVSVLQNKGIAGL